MPPLTVWDMRLAVSARRLRLLWRIGIAVISFGAAGKRNQSKGNTEDHHNALR